MLCKIGLTDYYNNKLVISMNLAELKLYSTMGQSGQQVFSKSSKREVIFPGWVGDV